MSRLYWALAARIVLFLFPGVALATPTITSINPGSGPIGTPVTINGSGFTSAQGAVALNGTSAAVSSWSDTAIVAIVPNGASSGSFSVTVGSETATSSTFTVTALPSAWSQVDIGSVGVSGSGSYANGTFTIQGAGQQIYGTADSFHYVYQSLDGDWAIVARLVSVQGNSTNGAAGVMIRQTLDATALNAKTADWPAFNGIYFDLRQTQGGSTLEPGGVSAAMPKWVKVARNGNSFTSFYGSDGVNWTQIGSSVTINMASSVYFGLAVTSGSTSALV